MATWVIGDIHGCWETLQRLLDRIRWDPTGDELWLVGDLVNRGPRSVDVLRWAVQNDRRIVSVLGNHDLHLLGRARGVRAARSEDRLDDVLGAEDRDELLGWLGGRPFLHRRDSTVMVHAGLWPEWTLAEAKLEAKAVAATAAAEIDGLVHRFNSKPKPVWRTGLSGAERRAAAAAVFTLLRMVGADGRPEFGYTGSPDDAPAGYRPWFDASRIVADGHTVIFGHWAQLGARREGGVMCMDSGCVYGRSLTALRLDDGKMVQQALADEIGLVGG